MFARDLQLDPGRMGGWGEGDFVSTMPGCVCLKVKDKGPFSVSSE